VLKSGTEDEDFNFDAHRLEMMQSPGASKTLNLASAKKTYTCLLEIQP
jgi:hypothetical protein